MHVHKEVTSAIAHAWCRCCHLGTPNADREFKYCSGTDWSCTKALNGFPWTGTQLIQSTSGIQEICGFARPYISTCHATWSNTPLENTKSYLTVSSLFQSAILPQITKCSGKNGWTATYALRLAVPPDRKSMVNPRKTSTKFSAERPVLCSKQPWRHTQELTNCTPWTAKSQPLKA